MRWPGGVDVQLSRRSVLAIGGGLVALLSGATVWKTRSDAGSMRSSVGDRAMEQTVDYNGWMLTAADKKKMDAQ
jgi:hypothetical protein